MNDDVRKIIVLADNDPIIVRAYKAGLESAGYTVIVAEDGEEAVRQIRALHPDLVLLELILPKLDGFTVLKTAKSDMTVSDVPVVILTNLSQASDRQEALQGGAVDVLVKSEVSLKDVLLSIERVLTPKS